MPQTRLGAVVVTYNSAGHIPNCLAALEPRCTDIVVVDNASMDSTCEAVGRFPRVRLIANTGNRGFAAAVNQGFRALDSELALVLNPDVFVHDGLDRLAACFEAPRVAVAAGLLLNADSSPQTGFSVRRFPGASTLVFESLGINRMFPGNPVNRRYRCLDLELTRKQPVEQPAGAFLAIRRSVWAELGGFDESFHPLWFEDVDFLKRVQDCGYETILEPDAQATHAGGHSVEQIGSDMRRLYWYGSLLKYSAKQFGSLRFRTVCGAVALGAATRLGLSIFAADRDRSANGDIRVMQMALRCFFGSRAGVLCAQSATATNPSMSSHTRSGQPNVLR